MLGSGSRARRPLALAVAAGTAASLVSAPAAGADMRTVDAGPFGKSQQGAFRKAAADANAYFRRVTTIRKGDSVKWRINGFHTVTFVPAGGVTPSLLAPDASSPVSGVNDPAGAPFWFNGQPRLIFNPAAGAPAGPKTFRRGTLHNSGVPSEDGPPKPYKLTFKTKGTFRYICLIHPEVAGLTWSGLAARSPCFAAPPHGGCAFAGLAAR